MSWRLSTIRSTRRPARSLLARLVVPLAAGTLLVATPMAPIGAQLAPTHSGAPTGETLAMREAMACAAVRQRSFAAWVLSKAGPRQRDTSSPDLEHSTQASSASTSHDAAAHADDIAASTPVPPTAGAPCTDSHVSPCITAAEALPARALAAPLAPRPPPHRA